MPVFPAKPLSSSLNAPKPPAEAPIPTKRTDFSEVGPEKIVSARLVMLRFVLPAKFAFGDTSACHSELICRTIALPLIHLSLSFPDRSKFRSVYESAFARLALDSLRMVRSLAELTQARLLLHVSLKPIGGQRRPMLMSVMTKRQMCSGFLYPFGGHPVRLHLLSR